MFFLKTTFTYHNDPVFQCRYKENASIGRPDHEYIVRDLRAEKDCLKIGTEPIVIMDNVELYSCLCHPNFQHPQYSLIYELYRNFKKGIMPYPGSYMEQPALAIEAIQYIDGLVSEKEYKDQLKANQKVNNNG